MGFLADLLTCSFLLVLRVGSVALFVFFAGAAGALVVTAYYFAGVAWAGAVGVGRGGADGAGLVKFALLLLLELALECVDGGGGCAVGWRCRWVLPRGGGVGVLRWAGWWECALGVGCG